MTKKIRYSKVNGSSEDDTHSKYWEKRVANHVWTSYNTLEEENYALIGYYDKTLNDIRLQLYNLAEREKSGDLTRTQRYLKNHLEELRKQIEDECEKLGKKVESKATSNIIKEMQSNSQNIFSNISGGKFSMLSKNTCKEILNNPWHGSYFSKRLWKDTGKLAIDLNDILAVGISQGKTVAEMAFELSNRVHQSMNSVHRLVRTETINALNNATLRSYKEASVKFVRWWAAEDERTCKVCGENHGKVYPIDKAPNLPCHPGCRCTWLPVFEDELTQQDLEHLKNIGAQGIPYMLKQKKNYHFSDGRNVIKNPQIRDAIIFVNNENVEFIYPKGYNKDAQRLTPRFMMETYEKLSPKIKKSIDKVEMLDYFNPLDEYWINKYPEVYEGSHSFATSNENGHIYFWQNDYANDVYLTEKYVIRTYCHEAAHGIDKSGTISSSVIWKEAMHKDKEAPSIYANNALEEDFAESVAEYYFDEESFKAHCPERYKVIKELMNS